MLSNGGKVCDWIENFCNVPEGMSIAAPVLLHQFQVESIYKIYNNDGAGRIVTVANEAEADDVLLEERDRAALDLALKVCRAQSVQRSQQLDKMLETRTRTRVAKFAAFACQCKALRLKPHEVPPCHVNNPNTVKREERDAAKLLRRMLRHGVSRFHPSPLAAIERVQDADRGPHVTPWAVEMFKMAGRGHDFRVEIHEELRLGPQHPNVLDVDILGDPPAGLTDVELDDWKLAQRLLGQLIGET